MRVYNPLGVGHICLISGILVRDNLILISNEEWLTSLSLRSGPQLRYDAQIVRSAGRCHVVPDMASCDLRHWYVCYARQEGGVLPNRWVTRCDMEY